MGAAASWIARYEDYANCKKDIARRYGNILRSKTSVLGVFGPMEGTQLIAQYWRGALEEDLCVSANT